MSRLYDGQERPVQTPGVIPGWPVVQGADDGSEGAKPRPAWSRYMGTTLPGGLTWLASDGIPTTGTHTWTKVIVAAPEQAITLCESETYYVAFPETVGNSLRCVVSARVYCAAVARYSGGVSVITGSGYSSTAV